MATNSANIVVGRLLEVRVDAGYRSISDVDELFDRIDAEVAKLIPKRRIVTVTDWRRCPVSSGDAAERLLHRVTLTNRCVERSAAIASPTSPTAVLQLMRVIREAGLPDRRMFFSAEEQIAWLAEVLTAAETRRLREFLGSASLPPSRAVI